MYRVMIIDDERALRNLLRITIEKEVPQVEVVGEAASGIEAINIIDTLNPHIVFVDIRMPFMDGIEFSNLARKRYPDLKIIILTAFSEFEYARKCIGIGVCEYLLKPITREEIKETLTKTIEKIGELKPQKIEEEVYQDNNTMEEIKDYIGKYYQDADMNLTSIALKHGFNSSYLSRTFKAKIGIGLIDYLTSIRMEKAIEYAKKGELMYIAAKQVGIVDPNYFGKCFKKYTGKAYSEYSK